MNAPITGRRVVLDPMTPDDIPEFYRMAARSDGTPYWYGELYGDTVPTYEQFLVEYPIHYFDGSRPSAGRAFFILAGGRRVGAVAYNEIDEPDRSVELDIIIADESDTGKGYGPDALAALARRLFDAMNVRRCFIIPIASNERAVRAYAKTGFKPLRTFVEDGREYIFFELTKPAAGVSEPS